MFQHSPWNLNTHHLDFFENLLNLQDQQYYDCENELSKTLMLDIQNRQQWFDRINNSLISLGLTDIVGMVNASPGTNTITNTTYLECWRELCDTYNTEIFQPMNLLNYDIKYRSFLDQNPELAQQIDQLEKYGKMTAEMLNLKLCSEWKEYIPELKKIISSCFLTGGAVGKVFFHPDLGRPTLRMIEPENFIIDPNASSLETAETITHIFTLTEDQLQSLIHSKIYIDIGIQSNYSATGQSESVRQTREEISAVQRNQYDKDNEYQIAETIFMAYPEDLGDEYGASIANGKKLPYKTHYQIDTGVALMRKRCWYPNLDRIKKKIDMVKFTYNQTMNFWGIGMINTLENLHNNASQVQTILDEALKYASIPTTIQGSQTPFETNNITLKPGKHIQINTNSENLNPLTQLRFAPPSPIFMEYLNYIEGKMKGINAISQIRVETLPANIKGSVLLMLLADEYKNMSVVMAQMIRSMDELFEIIKFFMMNEMGDQYFINKDFQLLNKDIFKEIIDYKSTADPNYSNSSMQFVLYQTIFEFAGQHPELFKLRELYARLLTTLKITNIDKLLYTQEELMQMQQQQMQMQQQQAQMQQQQVQAQMQAQQTQQQIMIKELELKEKKDQMELELQKLKQETESQISVLKIQGEAEKEEADIEQQRMIEYERHLQILANYQLKVKELELKYGIKFDPNKVQLPKETDSATPAHPD